jgi:hypothetical protein
MARRTCFFLGIGSGSFGATARTRKLSVPIDCEEPDDEGPREES